MDILNGLVEKFKSTPDVDDRLLIATEYIELSNKIKPLNWIQYYPNYPSAFEIFQDITGFEGIYQIGNWGTVKSKEGFFIKNRKGGNDKMAVYKEGKIRLSYSSHKLYPKISLWENGKAFYFNIHRLVAIHFIPNPNNLPQVLHKDDNPQNPKWDNLWWGTQKENIKDSVNKGRWSIGVKNGNSKLDENKVREIRKLLEVGESSTKISTKIGASKSQILAIKNNKIWLHVK
jgi:hypothetical protein